MSVDFSLLSGDPAVILPQIVEMSDAHLLVGDFSPLRRNRQWKEMVSANITIPFHEVDGHNIIPAWVTSQKREYGAYTIRPRINRLLPDYLTDFPEIVYHPHVSTMAVGASFLHHTVFSPSTPVTTDQRITIGEKNALAHMRKFIKDGLNRYAETRNNPNCDGQSGLSPSLHFGHLSPQRVAFEVMNSDADITAKNVFLEELVVRRELADNFCLYEHAYDSIASFPDWAKRTHEAHRGDERPALYTLKQFENGETHEQLWNSCQRNLIGTGKLHGYLRMYWAKKILEWTMSAEEAMAYAVYLNDTYSLDGRDPNGYAGIAWSIGGVHDRAWPERNIFGKIRYMNEKGCRRKFDVDEYIATSR